MTRAIRRIAILVATVLVGAFSAVAAISPAQASAPLPDHAVTSQTTPKPTTMFIYNCSGQTIKVAVFVRIETLQTRTLAPGEIWQLPETFGPMNEISVQFPNEPNYAFLGHFNYDSGGFHFIDARCNHLGYNVVGGKNHGIAFTPVGPSSRGNIAP